MGKRILKNKIEQNRRIIRIIILLLILMIILYMFLGMYKENVIRLQENRPIFGKEIDENQIVMDIPNTQTLEKNLEQVNLQIPETYLNFEVTAKLEVPKINLETYVLKEYKQEGLSVCASKYWGPEPNCVGNFCIAGHNYNKERMFNHLIDLQIGDEIYLTDNVNGKQVYTIYDIYKVKPNNTEPLNQETEGNKIITLITCVNYSRNRLIVQAREM